MNSTFLSAMSDALCGTQRTVWQFVPVGNGGGGMQTLDIILMLFYQLTGHPVVDYLIGTFCLSLMAVALGEATVYLGFRINKGHYRRLNAELENKHRLSMVAASLDDKASYKACNREANDAYGRFFFNMFGLSAASLWPACFALAWMQFHFADIVFAVPLTNWRIGYVAIFIFCYIPDRIFIGCFRRFLPGLRKGDHMTVQAAPQSPAL